METTGKKDVKVSPDEEKLKKLKFVQLEYFNSLSENQIQQFHVLPVKKKVDVLTKFKIKTDQYTIGESSLLKEKAEDFEEINVLINKYLHKYQNKELKRLKTQLVKTIKLIDEQIETNFQKEREISEKKLAKEIEELEKQIANKKDKLNFHL